MSEWKEYECDQCGAKWKYEGKVEALLSFKYVGFSDSLARRHFCSNQCLCEYLIEGKLAEAPPSSRAEV